MVTTIGERIITAEVDRKELANDLRISARVAHFRNRRPGEPYDLTKTNSDPISIEHCTTLHVIYRALSKKQG